MITSLSQTDIALLRQMAAEFRAKNPGTVSRQPSRQPQVLSGARVKIGKTTALVETGDLATIDIWKRDGARAPAVTTETIEAYYDWLSTESISSGKMVLIQWFSNENCWRIVGAECE